MHKHWLLKDNSFGAGGGSFKLSEIFILNHC
jgi:hypothetical protein